MVRPKPSVLVNPERAFYPPTNSKNLIWDVQALMMSGVQFGISRIRWCCPL